MAKIEDPETSLRLEMYLLYNLSFLAQYADLRSCLQSSRFHKPLTEFVGIKFDQVDWIDEICRAHNGRLEVFTSNLKLLYPRLLSIYTPKSDFEEPANPLFGVQSKRIRYRLEIMKALLKNVGPFLRVQGGVKFLPLNNVEPNDFNKLLISKYFSFCSRKLSLELFREKILAWDWKESPSQIDTSESAFEDLKSCQVGRYQPQPNSKDSKLIEKDLGYLPPVPKLSKTDSCGEKKASLLGTTITTLVKDTKSEACLTSQSSEGNPRKCEDEENSINLLEACVESSSPENKNSRKKKGLEESNLGKRKPELDEKIFISSKPVYGRDSSLSSANSKMSLLNANSGINQQRIEIARKTLQEFNSHLMHCQTTLAVASVLLLPKLIPPVFLEEMAKGKKSRVDSPNWEDIVKPPLPLRRKTVWF